MNEPLLFRAGVRWSIVGIVLLGATALAVLRGYGPGPGGGLGSGGTAELVARPSATSAAPRVLKPDRDSVDFGEIPLGETRSTRIRFENPGTKSIQVCQVVSECVCVVGKMSSRTVEPGDSETLEITFRGIPGRSAYKSSVSIITDEAGACRYDVAISAKIRQEYLLEPELLDFGRIPKGQSVKRVVRIRRCDGAAFGIKEILPHRPDLAVAWRPVDATSKEFVLETQARGDHAGIRTDRLRIVTEGSPESTAELEIALEVESSFISAPSTVTSRYGADGRLLPFETVVRDRSGGKATVESVRDSRGAALQYEARAGEGGECRLLITITGDLPVDQHVGSFLVRMKGEEQPIGLPYRVESDRSSENK